MKVLLVLPRIVHKGGPRPVWSPLGLAFLAARLRADGHVVEICDRHALAMRIGPDLGAVDRAMRDRIRAFRPDLVGLSTLSPLIFDTAHCAALIRELSPAPIVAGGHHATAMPRLTLERIPALSGVVAQEGEIPISALAGGADPASVPGVLWRGQDGSIAGVAPEINRSLDRLPFPAMDLLDMDYYAAPGFTVFRGRYLSSGCVLASRGCPRRCAFCAESLTMGHAVRRHSPDYVVAWIRKLLVDHGVEGICFLDNDFLSSEEAARALCEAMLAERWPRRFCWTAQARADAVRPEMLALMKRAGLVTLEIGVESASGERLERIDKETAVEANDRAIALCREAGVAAFAYLISGFPGETLADLEAALAWVRRVRPSGFLLLPLHRYPGTPLYESHGERFFETCEWSAQNLEGYYRRPGLSAISEEALEAWMERRYRPYETWLRFVSALRSNPPLRLLSAAVSDPGAAWEVVSRSARACCGTGGRAGCRE